MVSCPDCRERLSGSLQRFGANWTCTKCGGRSIDFSWVREHGGEELVEWFLAPARRDISRNHDSCPMCGDKMQDIPFPIEAQTIQFVVCPRCRLVWFSATSLQVLAKEFPDLCRSLSSPSQNLSEDSTFTPESIQKLSARQHEGRKGSISSPGKNSPEEPLLGASLSREEPAVRSRWQWIAGLLGMPIERGTPRRLSKPWITWAIAGIITIVSFDTSLRLDHYAFQYGWVPALWWRYGGLTLITSFFIHGGFAHLLGNLYFLLVFGDNVEDYLGWRRYTLLLILATITGNLLHSLSASDWFIPAIGASGGISGIVVFYGLTFPRTKITVLTRSFLFVPIRLNAFTAMCVWIVFQFIGVLKQFYAISDISSLAHLGGGIVGFGFWWLYRSKRILLKAYSGA